MLYTHGRLHSCLRIDIIIDHAREHGICRDVVTILASLETQISIHASHTTALGGGAGGAGKYTGGVAQGLAWGYR